MTVVPQFVDAVTNIAKSTMVTGLGRRVEVNLWIPATGKFLDRRDIDGSVMKIL